MLFLEEIKEDYLNSDLQLRIALDKFVEWYQVVKSVSISCLTAFLYNISSHVDLTVRIRSGSMIRVQVESVKRCKTEGFSRKRKLPTFKNKENLDPQTIPNRKIKKQVTLGLVEPELWIRNVIMSTKGYNVN